MKEYKNCFFVTLETFNFLYRLSLINHYPLDISEKDIYFLRLVGNREHLSGNKEQGIYSYEKDTKNDFVT